jgi:uncharacterized protein YmfQ (DUF2313 family)
MAFEDAYGEVSSTSYVKGFEDQTNDSYVIPLLQLLPPGPIWRYEDGDEFYSLLQALSYALLRVESRGEDLVEEFDPRTTFELLADWERVLDLPGDNPSPASTLAERRAAVHAKLLGHGDPTVSFYEGVADGLGYGATVAHKLYSPFVPGSRAGDPLTNSEWAHSWNLLAHSSTNDDGLRWTIERTVPSHTKINYSIFDWFDAETAANFGSSFIRAAAFADQTPYPKFVVVGGDGKLRSSNDCKLFTSRTSNFGASDINDVIWAGGLSLFIAVGEDGKISTSPFGTTWTARTSNFGTTEIQAVTYDATIGMAIAVGNSGKLSSSPDGITWTARTSQFGTSTIYNIMSNGSLFIATGSAGKISTSTDGINWTARTSGSGALLWSVAWKDPTNIWDSATEQFVTVAASPPAFIVSSDGATWTLIDPPADTTLVNSIAYGNGVYVAAGQNNSIPVVFYSVDGQSWEVIDYGVSATGISANITFGFGLFLVVDSGGNVAVSANGRDWATSDESFPSSAGVAEFIGNNTYGFMVVGGTSGALYTAFIARNEAAVGHHLLTQTGPSTSNLNAIAVDDTGLFCAVGNLVGGATFIATTIDGITWSQKTVSVNDAILRDIHFDIDSRLWVAVGDVSSGDALILTSPNTLVWTERANPSANILYSVACYSGTWVAVGAVGGGDAYIITSVDDGVTWVERANPATQYLSSVAHDDSGNWMAVGNNGTVLTSPDAITWTLQTAPVAVGLLGVLYDSGHSMWLAVGSSPTGVLASFDGGVTWVSRGLSNLFAHILETESNEFLAAGGGGIAGSTGGDAWAFRAYDLGGNVAGMAYYSNLLICVGSVDPASSTAYVLTSEKESE